MPDIDSWIGTSNCSMMTNTSSPFDWTSVRGLRSPLGCTAAAVFDTLYSRSAGTYRGWLAPRWRREANRLVSLAEPDEILLFRFPITAYAVEDWLVRPIAAAWHARLKETDREITAVPRCAFVVPHSRRRFALACDLRFRWRDAFRRVPPEERLAVPILLRSNDVRVVHFLGPSYPGAIETVRTEPIITADILRRREELRPGGAAARRAPSHRWSNQLAGLLQCGLLRPIPADIFRAHADDYARVVGIEPGRRPLKAYWSIPVAAASCAGSAPSAL